MTSPSFKSGFNPPAKPQVSTKSGGASVLASRGWPVEAYSRPARTPAPPARNSRRDFSAFWRPMPVSKIVMPVLPAAIFRNGAASSFRAKQMSVDIFSIATIFEMKKHQRSFCKYRLLQIEETRHGQMLISDDLCNLELFCEIF